VHAGVRVAFAGQAVKTVTEAGWRGSKDGPLLSAAEQTFDVFVTIDRRLERQYNLAKYRLGFVIVRVPSNMLSSFEPIFDELAGPPIALALAKSFMLAPRGAPRTDIPCAPGSRSGFI